jgi:hypothetical protein
MGKRDWLVFASLTHRPPTPPPPHSPARLAVPTTTTHRPARPTRGAIIRAEAVSTKTVRIGTRGSPLAMAQAYLTRDLLKVRKRGYRVAHCPPGK